MIMIILGVISFFLLMFISVKTTQVRGVVLAFSVLCFHLIGALICNYIANEVFQPIITEQSERYSIEYMDKDIVKIEGMEYIYEVRYDKTAEEPFAVIAEVEASMLYKLFSYEKAEDLAYVYTNNVAIFSEEK